MNRPGLDQVRLEGLKAFSMVPIVEEGRLVGVLNVASRHFNELPMPARTALESVAGVVSSVLVRLRAQEALRRANAELEQRVIERTRELARSEAKFRTLFESTRDAIVISGQTGSALDCNPAALQLFGYTVKREFLAQSVEALSPERQSDGRCSRDAFLENQELVLGQGSHFHEWDHRRYDGSVFPAEVSTGVAVIDGQTVLLSMIRDISQRRAAENRLRASEAQFRRLLELAPLPMGLASREGGMVLLNRRFTQTFGYGIEGMPDMESWWRQAYPDPGYRAQLLQRWTAAVGEAARTGSDIEPLECSVTCRDGSLREVIISGIQLDAQVLATFLDVTQLRVADADLRKLRSAVEQSPAVVVITDPRGRIEYVNPTFEAQTGYRAAEALGRNPRLLKSGAHSPAFYADLWGTLREKRVWRGELCNRRKDGSLFWESTAIAPVLGADGRVTHYVAIKEDITERRRAAAELHEAKEAAEAANQAKSRFLANMSHEIRTPMNVILGFAQLLQREATLDARQRQYLGTLNRSGEHLLRLINDILDMSRIEAGRLPLVPADCDFDGLIDEVSGAFRLRAEESGLDLVVSREAGVPARVHTDSGRVRQILLNLLGNAFKFTSHGRIEVRVSSGPVSVDTAPPQSTLLAIEVSDTGAGIPPAELERIFQPFEQSRTGESHGGTGLGLTISRQLARMLGGEITVTSRVGIGSTFRFTFQAIALPSLEKAPSAAPESRRRLHLAPGSASPMILIVDDIPANRDLLRLPLEEAGFATREAVDGSEAVRLAGSLRPDLILMDLRMPVLDGLAATREIRRLHAQVPLRILVVSAGVLEISESEWRSAGADGFLGTPVRHSELLSRVGGLLQVAIVEQPPAANASAATSSSSSSAGAAETGFPASLLAAASRLPAELRELIIAATEVGDVTGLRRLVNDQVCPIDAALGQLLGQWVGAFDYLALLDFLRQTDSSPP
jgi:PAS domain S-box-containing protein